MARTKRKLSLLSPEGSEPAPKRLRSTMPFKAYVFLDENKVEHKCKPQIEIGNGTYSRVFESSGSLNRMFALKLATLKDDFTQEHGYVSIATELRCFQKLGFHKHITPVFAGNAHEGYLIMPLLTKNLSEYIRSIEPKKLDSIACAAQLLDGLKFIHSKNIIHMDLKPHNILMEQYGDFDVRKDTYVPHLRISDFGSSCFTSNGNKISDEPQQVTHLYRPPEILLGGTQYSFATDMWSFGCVFWEICTMSWFPLFDRPELKILDEKQQVLNAIAAITTIPPDGCMQLRIANEYKRRFPDMYHKAMRKLSQEEANVCMYTLVYDADMRVSASKLEEIIRT